MNIRTVAEPRRWRVPNTSPNGSELTIAGWDFGGSGPLAVLHHANGMCAATWALVATELTRKYRVMAIDARGHGDSEHLTVPDDYAWRYFVEDLLAVTEQMLVEVEADKVALGVGSSFGGIITAAAEALHGGRFEQIVMLDPPIHPTLASAAAVGFDFTPGDGDERDLLVAQTKRRRAVWNSRAEAREAWRDKPLFAAWREQGFELYLAEGLGDAADGQVALKCDPTVEGHIFATTGSLDVLDFAPKVDVPVYLVHAAKGYFPEAFFRGLVGLFPDARFSQLQGGHMLPLEVPQQVVDFILAIEA